MPGSRESFEGGEMNAQTRQSVPPGPEISRSLRLALGVLALCFASYLWVFNNGFISDDYIILDQVSSLHSLLAQLGSAPNSFRFSSFVWFGVLQSLFGPQPEVFYFCSILLHFGNCVLLGLLAFRLTGDQGAGLYTSLVFAAVQNPAEAVAWLAAVNELLAGFFVLSALLAALSRRPVVAVALYGGALLSKESALVMPLLLMLFFSHRSERPDRKVLYLLWSLSIAYLLWFAATSQENPLLNQGFYRVGLHGVAVLLLSAHKIAFPWMYLAFLLTLRAGGQRLLALQWLALALLPYVFLTYQLQVPSRHMYLASMAAACFIASLIRTRKNTLRTAFLLAFCLGNVGYLWLVKDRQFEIRAAPTTQLLAILPSERADCLLVTGFPDNPWILKSAARLVKDWRPDMIHVNQSPPPPDCGTLSWNPRTRTYTRSNETF
jgi:hypothetical protein